MLIVFEGLDRSGKTTQTKRLAFLLESLGIRVKKMRFPERDTEIGKMISLFLENKKKMSQEFLHLLFSANRWELKDEIEDSLLQGQIVLIDRYAYSGIAYSGAKGMDINWCKSPDTGTQIS